MENNVENVKPNFKIYVINVVASFEKRVIEKFTAKDRDEAYKYLCDKYRSLNDGNTYYYGKIHYHSVLHKDGTTTEHEADSWLDGNYSSKFAKWWDDFCFNIGYYLFTKPRDWWYAVEDFFFLVKNKMPKSALWSLDSHILNEIKVVVPRMLDKRVGYSTIFVDMAVKQLHGNEEGFNIEEYHNKHWGGYPKEVEDLAIEIMKKTHMELVYHIKLYEYIEGFGIIDPNNADEVAFDKENRHLLPVYEGTYDDVDYVKQHELVQREWNAIWDWMKEYGHTLWD